MSNVKPEPHDGHQDVAPGDDTELHDVGEAVRGYLIGFVLSIGLTALSFYLVHTTAFWRPSIPIALSVLAVAQMGVHLVFFLHMTTAPDNLNNAMALAFGLLIVLLVVLGSLWIMDHLNTNMMPMDQMMNMQR